MELIERLEAVDQQLDELISEVSDWRHGRLQPSPIADLIRIALDLRSAGTLTIAFQGRVDRAIAALVDLQQR